MIIDLLRIISLLATIFTFLWLVLVIIEMQKVGNIDTFERALTHVSKRGWLFFVNYINAAFITIVAIMLFTGLYLYFEAEFHNWSFIALIFVPIYGVLNLLSYLSQVTVIPSLLRFREKSKNPDSYDALIGQMVHLLPGSVVSIFNSLAYAVLGIPSVIFGVFMLNEGILMSIAGVLILLNGVACIIGFIGLTMQNAHLKLGTMIGGVLFATALIPLTIAFYQM